MSTHSISSTSTTGSPRRTPRDAARRSAAERATRRAAGTTSRIVSVRCDAILFDLDGVLVDSTRVVERQWEIWARARGFDPHEILAVAHGRRIIETLRIVAPEYATPEEVDRLVQAEAADVEGLRVVPGARSIVDALPPDAWAVVTSGSTPVASVRLQHGGFPAPRVLVTADDVNEGKPAPEPYLRAAELLGLRPERCVVIEDAPAGIKSASAAGMHSIGIAGTFPAAALSGATIVVDRLDQIQVEVLDWGRSRIEILVDESIGR